MTTKRQENISNKIFSKNDVRHLWSIVANEANVIPSKQKESTSLLLSIKTTDGFTEENETDVLLSDNDVIDRKRCEQLSIVFRNHRANKRIRIELTHGNNEFSNNLIVEGKNRDWVISTYEKLNEFLKSVFPQ